jgi:integrase/recombinase XerD
MSPPSSACALVAVMTLRVEDYYPQKKRWWLRLREKDGEGQQNARHHKLESYLDAYLEAAAIGDDRKRPLFRAALGRTGNLSTRPLSRTDVWYMIQRRAADAKLETSIGCHTFRGTGITDYLSNRGKTRDPLADGRPIMLGLTLLAALRLKGPPPAPRR